MASGGAGAMTPSNKICQSQVTRRLEYANLVGDSRVSHVATSFLTIISEIVTFLAIVSLAKTLIFHNIILSTLSCYSIHFISIQSTNQILFGLNSRYFTLYINITKWAPEISLEISRKTGKKSEKKIARGCEMKLQNSRVDV